MGSELEPLVGADAVSVPGDVEGDPVVGVAVLVGLVVGGGVVGGGVVGGGGAVVVVDVVGGGGAAPVHDPVCCGSQFHWPQATSPVS